MSSGRPLSRSSISNRRPGRRGRSCPASTPRVTPAAAERIATRAGGNPLLLEELSVSGEPSESLELALAARLRALAPESRETLGTLALLGRPLDEADLPNTKELVQTGLLLFVNGTVAFRHPLLAEVAAAGLDENDRRRLHSRLAGLVVRAGEAARHHLAAGERDLAYDRALEAAEQAEHPGELAAHLEVAASCAPARKRMRSGSGRRRCLSRSAASLPPCGCLTPWRVTIL